MARQEPITLRLARGGRDQLVLISAFLILGGIGMYINNDAGYRLQQNMMRPFAILSFVVGLYLGIQLFFGTDIVGG